MRHQRDLGAFLIIWDPVLIDTMRLLIRLKLLQLLDADRRYAICPADPLVFLIASLRKGMDAMCLRSRNNLFDCICEKAHEIKEKDDIPNEVNMLLNGIADEIAFQHKELSRQMPNVPSFNIDSLKSKMEGLTSGNALIQHAVIHKELNCLGRMEQSLLDLAVTVQI